MNSSQITKKLIEDTNNINNCTSSSSQNSIVAQAHQSQANVDEKPKEPKEQQPSPHQTQTESKDFVKADGFSLRITAGLATSVKLTQRHESLGSGAFSTVCAATWAGAKIAVKSSKYRTLDALEAFQKEAQKMQALNELGLKSMPKFFGFNVDTKGAHIYMEFIPGDSLNYIINRQRMHREPCNTSILPAITAACSEVASHNIVHTDLKPHNLMLKPNGEIIVIDWDGAVKLESASSTFIGPRRHTLLYLAPECLIKSHYSLASDVYSIGTTIGELACNILLNRELEEAEDYCYDNEIKDDIRNNVRPTEEALASRSNAGLASLIKTCWQTKPTARPTMDALHTELQTVSKEFKRNAFA